MLGTELRGKQLGIVGRGRIGRAVAAKAPAFGMHVVFAARGTGRARTTSCRSTSCCVSSDVVSLHVPLTPDTRHLIDRKALARMKRSAFLINTARGPVVDEEALAWALKERLIAGAALDVYEHEPEVHPELLRSRTSCWCRTSAARRARRARRWPTSPSATCSPCSTGSRRSRRYDAAGRSPRCRAAASRAVMRRLAQAIDGLEEPAVEKIAESSRKIPSRS